jgi:hypothetical protein
MEGSGEAFQDVELSSGAGLPIVVTADAVQSEIVALQIGFQRGGVSLLMGKQVALRATRIEAELFGHLVHSCRPRPRLYRRFS